jgi:hypothetical protein
MLTLAAPGQEAEAAFLTSGPEVQLSAWFYPFCRPLATRFCWHPNAGSLGDNRR